MTPIEEYVIWQVKRLRMEKGLSQQAFGDTIDLSQGFIGDCENPRKRAKYNLRHLNEIVKVFGCDFSYFFPDKPL